MLFNNIIERRMVNAGHHRLVLEIAASDYNKVYEQYNNEIASEIIKRHLGNRGDDGRPSDIQITQEDNGDIIKIYANVNYLENDHTGYGIH